MAQMDSVIFGQKWEAEAIKEWQQVGSKLLDKVRLVRKPGVKTYNFSRINAADDVVTGKARTADVVYQNEDWTAVPVTAAQYYIAHFIEDFDQIQTDIDLRAEVTWQVVNKLRRKQDDVIIAKLNGSSNAITMPTANTLNLAGVQELTEAFDVNDVDPRNRYLVASPYAITDLRTDANYANNFHNANRIAQDGVIDRASGFDFIQRTRLPNGAGGATQRRCFAFHKSRVGVFMNQDFKLMVERVPQKNGWQVLATVSMEAAILDPKGVAYADIANA